MVETLQNLTPHAVTLIGADIVVLPPTGQIARVSSARTQMGTVAGVPVFRSVFGVPTGVPEPTPGTGFVVATLVRLALPDRVDLFSPGELVRGVDGQPLGCKSLEGNL